MTKPPPRSLLSATEAAQRLGVSYPTLKRWIYQGAIRTSRTEGGHHRIAESEVERFLARDGGAAAPRGPRRRSAPRFVVAISGRNRLRGTVEEVRVEGLLAQVRMRVGDQWLTAVITRDAVDELKLKRGEEATAIIKSTEVMVAREV